MSNLTSEYLGITIEHRPGGYSVQHDGVVRLFASHAKARRFIQGVIPQTPRTPRTANDLALAMLHMLLKERQP